MVLCRENLCLLFSLLWLAVSGVEAADWPHWRGPLYNGSTSETGLPATWSRTQGVAWRTAMPGPSEATPIVAGERVYVSSADVKQGKIVALALHAQTGKVIWQRDITQELRRDSRSTYGGPSPCANANVVVFFAGNGELVAFSPDGQERWRRNVQKDYGEFAFNWTFSSSPLLFGDTLYLQVLQRDVPVDGRGLKDRENQSYLLGLDPATGTERWRVVRPSDAQEETREAFSSPIPWVYQGRTEILVAGGDDITGHDPSTGVELWRWGTWNPTRITHWRFVPSPVAGAGIILACAPKNDPIYAVKAGGQGKLTDDALAWVSREEKNVTSDVPSPAFADGDFFVLSDGRKMLSRVDPPTGRVKWTAKTPGLPKYEASPLVADGKVYLINFAAEVAVFDAKQGQPIGEPIAMAEPGNELSDFNVRSSVIAANGHLFIRTNTHLYCIGQP